MELTDDKKRLPRWAVWLLTLAVLQALFAVLIILMIFVDDTDFHSATVDAAADFSAAVSREDPEALAALSPLERGNAKAETFYSYESNGLFSTTYCYVLLCQYEAEEYPAEKAAAEARYVFRTKPLETGKVENGKALMVSPYARIGSDEFRFVIPEDDPENKNIQYCFYHRSVMIVTNDETKEIGFLFFKDKELDEAEDLTRFLNKYCGWSMIRQER